MILFNLRSLVIGGLLIGLASGFALSVNAGAAQQGTPVQMCNSDPVDYSVPGGFTSGTGLTKSEAARNAYLNMLGAGDLYTADCAKCPATNVECPNIKVHSPAGEWFGPAWYDFILQMWHVTIFWGPSTITKICDDC